jgi:dihydrofolate reductase
MARRGFDQHREKPLEHKRRIVMFNRVSADGYFGGPDGNLDWVVPDDQLDAEGAAGISNTDTMLFGRRTYDMFESFWPRALADEKGPQDPHGPKRRSDAISKMAVWINDATKVVFSRTRKQVTWKNSRLVSEFDPQEIAAMKRTPGKDMIVFGSGSIVSQLTEHGLIDEYWFIVAPVLLGSGKQVIHDVTKRSTLQLLEAKAYDSGNVRLRYARKV